MAHRAKDRALTSASPKTHVTKQWRYVRQDDVRDYVIRSNAAWWRRHHSKSHVVTSRQTLCYVITVSSRGDHRMTSCENVIT